MPFPATQPHRGEIYWANLSPVIGSEQGGRRPVLVISLDRDIPKLPTIVVAAVSTKVRDRTNPLAPVLSAGCPLPEESAVFTFQLRTLDKQRLDGYAGSLTPEQQQLVNQGLALSFGLARYLR